MPLRSAIPPERIGLSIAGNLPSAPEKELPEIAKFFGLYYNAADGQITHSMSTSLISPDGKIIAWFHDNDWQAVRSGSRRNEDARQCKHRRRDTRHVVIPNPRGFSGVRDLLFPFPCRISNFADRG